MLVDYETKEHNLSAKEFTLVRVDNEIGFSKTFKDCLDVEQMFLS